jgi:hypothetical protein
MMNKNKYALIIGCSYHPDNFDSFKIKRHVPQLKSAIINASNMYQLLNNDFYFDDVKLMSDILSFSNSDNPNSYVCSNISSVHLPEISFQHELFPTYNNIFTQIRDILIRARSGDEIVIFYAGHGIVSKQNNNKYIKYDKSSQGIIVPADYLVEGKIITSDVLHTLFREFGKRDVKILLIFDCCYQGTICNLEYTYEYDNEANMFYTKNYAATSDIELSDKSKYQNSKQLIQSIQSIIVTISAYKDKNINWQNFLKLNMFHGIFTSTFIHSIRSNPRYIKDIFTIVKDMDIIMSKYKQHAIITSNINLADNSNKIYKSIFDGAKYLKHGFDNNIDIDTDIDEKNNYCFEIKHCYKKPKPISIPLPINELKVVNKLKMFKSLNQNNMANLLT